MSQASNPSRRGLPPPVPPYPDAAAGPAEDEAIPGFDPTTLAPPEVHRHDHGPQPVLPRLEVAAAAGVAPDGEVPPGFTAPGRMQGVARTLKPEDDDLVVGRRPRHH